MATVDIIIPVYNSAAFLSEAVESILCQTFPGWNLFLVNDGSSDDSGKICDAYAGKDSRIHVFHTENHGVSHARNIGIQNSQSEWVMFLDSDDTVAPTILEALLANSSGMDLVSCCCTVTDRPDRQFVRETTCYSGVTAMSDLYCSSHGIVFFSVVWGKIYRRSCLSYLFDETMRHGEDLMFNLNNFAKLSDFCIIPDVLYNYVKKNDKSLTSKLWLDTVEFEWNVYQKTAEIFGNDSKVIHAFLTRCQRVFIAYFYNIINSPVLTEQQKYIILAQKLESELFAVKGFDAVDRHEQIWSFIRQGNLEALYNYCYNRSPSDLNL